MGTNHGIKPDYIYKYKGYIPLGVLGLDPDLVGVSDSGVKAAKLNAFINVKTAEKKLRFGESKCCTLSLQLCNFATFVKKYLYIEHWSETHDEEAEFQKVRNLGTRFLHFYPFPTLHPLY